MKTIVASLTVGIFVAVIVLSIIIILPDQIKAAQGMIKQESIHPCQKVTIENFEFYKKNANLLENPNTTKEELKKWQESAPDKVEQYRQIAIKNNCENTQSEWVTEEFMEKMKVLRDKGF